MVRVKTSKQVTSKKARPRKSRVKLSESEKLLKLCQETQYKGSNEGDHMLEILETYVKYHAVSFIKQVSENYFKAQYVDHCFEI